MKAWLRKVGYFHPGWLDMYRLGVKPPHGRPGDEDSHSSFVQEVNSAGSWDGKWREIAKYIVMVKVENVKVACHPLTAVLTCLLRREPVCQSWTWPSFQSAPFASREWTSLSMAFSPRFATTVSTANVCSGGRTPRKMLSLFSFSWSWRESLVEGLYLFYFAFVKCEAVDLNFRKGGSTMFTEKGWSKWPWHPSNPAVFLGQVERRTSLFNA